MTSSSDLANRLKGRGINVNVDPRLSPLGGWEDNYITPGHTHECHPDFVATPIGNSPYGFLVCQRKRFEGGAAPVSQAANNEPGAPSSKNGNGFRVSQSYNLYEDAPNALPGGNRLGGQPFYFQDRRMPNQAHLQGADYPKDPIRYRGIGIERIETMPGDYGHIENKYFYSTAPPRFDMTQAVQPFELWKREQLRNGHFTPQEMVQFEKQHTYVNFNPVF